MFIESVRLHNFLSFYDETVELDRGLTVIVGHNGSGKTSIFQGIKFAMGSNQRDERYPKWSDFVRNGASMAEVEVVLNINGTKRRILRKIDRRGHPQPYIDGKRVKAAYLQEFVSSLKFDVNNSLVFMPQEKINSLRDMNPITVRKLIEEGTGLDALRERILAQEVNVDLNRTRLQQTLEESHIVEKELEYIREKVERLKKKRELQKRENVLETEAKWALFIDRTDRVEETREKIEEQEQGLLEIFERSKGLQSEIKQREETISEIQEKIDSLRKEQMDIQLKINRKENEIESKRSEDRRNLEELKKLQGLLKKNERTLKDRKKRLVQIAKRREKLKLRAETLKESIEKYERDLEGVEAALDRFAEWTQKRNEMQGKLNAVLYDKKNKEFKLRSLKEKLLIEQAELEDIERSWQGIWSSLEDLDERELNRRMGAIEREIESLNEQRISMLSRLSDIKKQISTIKAQLAEKDNRIPEAVRSLKRAIDEHQLESVYGPISDLLGGVREFAELLEWVFPDNSIFSFIVTDKADGILVQKLRDGIGAPSPIVIVKGNATAEPIKLPKDPSIIGPLWDLLELDSHLAEVLKAAYGEFIVVKTNQAAKRIASRIGMNVVSLKGAVIIQREASLISLPVIEPSGILVTAPLQTRLKALQREEVRVNKQITEIMRKTEELREEGEQVRNTLSQIRSRTEVWEKRRVLSGSITTLQERIAVLNDELVEIDKQHGEYERGLRRLDESQPPEREKLVSRQRALNFKLRELAKEQLGIEHSFDSLFDEEDDIENKIKQLKEDNEMLSEQIIEIRESIDNSESAISDIMQEIEMLQQSFDNTNIEIIRLKEELVENEEELSELRERLVELNVAIRTHKTDVAHLRRQLTILEDELERLSSELKEKTRPESTRPLDQVQEELVEVKILLKSYEDVSESVAHKQEKLTERLNRLVEKSAELQRELEEAELAVKNIKEQYHNEMGEMLADIQNKINAILERIDFPGTVRLVLKNMGNEYGVEIKSNIKDTEYKDINACSGGERSLLSLGLILALQEFNAAPTYAFDEIDVFLDATNTENVASLLHNASLASQFIVFTPARSTIFLRYADKLLGVAQGRNRSSVIIEGPRCGRND